MREAVQAGHLSGQKLGLANVEAVRADDDHGAADGVPFAVAGEHLAQRVADAGAAVPVAGLDGGAGERLIGFGLTQDACQAGQAGAECERLPALVRQQRGVGKDQQRTRER